MKKTLWIAIAGAIAASVVATSAQEVLSGNAVGYIKRTVPSLGKLEVVCYSLNPMPSSGITYFTNTTVATDMPNGSAAFFWDSALQRWSGALKSGKGAWDGVAGAKQLLPGEMFFLKTPVAQATAQEVTITGEVPDDATLSRAVVGGNNIAALGNPYPVDVAFTNTLVARNAANGSAAFFWDPSLQRWNGALKSGKGAWDGVAMAKTVQAGEGFFMKDAGAGSIWTNSKPYTWP